MRALRFIWQRLRWPLLIAGIVAILFVRNVFEPLELMTHDLRFLLRGYRLATSQVVGCTAVPSWPPRETKK